MAEYIDKAVALSIHESTKSNRHYQTDNLDDAYGQGWDDALCSIEHIPAADVAPVVHGRWEWLGPNRLVTGCMCGTCSACGVRSKYIVNTMVCPNCGARMDAGGA